jgi:hypothetical protein
MDILEALESGMTGSGGGGDSMKDSFSSWFSVDVVSLSIISQLSLSQS